MAGARGVRAGRAFVEIFADDSKLRQGLTSASGKLKAFGKTVATVGSGLLAIGGAGVAAFAPTIKAASDFQETMSKFNTVFGSNSKAIKEWGDTFAAEVGRAKGDVARFLASTQDLLVPIGIDPKEAAKFSKQITKLTVDLASFNNMAEDDVMRDLQAALTGSGETMKKYGVIVSAAAVKQELFNQGLDPSSATEAQKALARLEIIMRGTTAAQGDAIRTAGSFANQSKALEAALTDLKVEIGTQLLPIVTPLVEKAIAAVKAFGEWADEHKELVPVIAKAVTGIAALGATLVTAGVAMNAMGTAISVINSLMGLVSGSALAAKAGIAGLAIAGIGLLAREIYRANPAIRAFNDELDRGRKLADRLSQKTTKRQGKFLSGLSGDPEERKAAIEAELSRLEKERQGQLNAKNNVKRQIGEFGTFANAVGNKRLEALREELKEVESRLEQSASWGERLRDELGAIESTNMTGMAPADFSAAVDGGIKAPAVDMNVSAGIDDIAERMNQIDSNMLSVGANQTLSQMLDEQRALNDEVREIKRYVQEFGLS